MKADLKQELGDTWTNRLCLPFTGGGEGANKGSSVRSMRSRDALPAGDCAEDHALHVAFRRSLAEQGGGSRDAEAQLRAALAAGAWSL